MIHDDEVDDTNRPVPGDVFEYADGRAHTVTSVDRGRHTFLTANGVEHDFQNVELHDARFFLPWVWTDRTS